MRLKEIGATRPQAALLFLRLGMGGSLLLLFGVMKIHDALAFMHTGQWSFVDFNRRLGLPLPVVVAFFETLNESLGALLVVLGLWTRYAAGSLVIGFAAATTCSLIVGEAAWQFAALYFLLAAAVWFGGPGKYSIDGRWAAWQTRLRRVQQ